MFENNFRMHLIIWGGGGGGDVENYVTKETLKFEGDFQLNFNVNNPEPVSGLTGICVHPFLPYFFDSLFILFSNKYSTGLLP